MIQEIQHLIHLILNKEEHLTFLWIPSHCNIFGNDKVDSLAKKGAQNLDNATSMPLKLDIHEIVFLINKTNKNKIIRLHQNSNSTYSKLCASDINSINPSTLWKTKTDHRSFILNSVISKIRLNSLKTKYTKHIACTCGAKLTINHILFLCPILQYQQLHKQDSLNSVLNSPPLLLDLAKNILTSPISNLI